jgi:hypothetical protein
MKVHIIIPYSVDKKLAEVYNEEMSRIPDGDTACILDYDVQLLTPDAGKIIHDYANKYPDAVLTCYTNRVSSIAKNQLLNGKLSGDTDIRNHIQIAEEQKKYLYEVTPIKSWIAGMLMVIPKPLWQQYQFLEGGKCLGVDTMYSTKLLRHRVPILRMEGLYVWHQYRLKNGIHNTKHLV